MSYNILLKQISNVLTNELAEVKSDRDKYKNLCV